MKPATQQQATEQQQRRSPVAASAAAVDAGIGACSAHEHTKVQHLGQRPNDVPRKHPLP